MRISQTGPPKRGRIEALRRSCSHRLGTHPVLMTAIRRDWLDRCASGRSMRTRLKQPPSHPTCAFSPSQRTIPGVESGKASRSSGQRPSRTEPRSATPSQRRCSPSVGLTIREVGGLQRLRPLGMRLSTSKGMVAAPSSMTPGTMTSTACPRRWTPWNLARRASKSGCPVGPRSL